MATEAKHGEAQHGVGYSAGIIEGLLVDSQWYRVVIVPLGPSYRDGFKAMLTHNPEDANEDSAVMATGEGDTVFEALQRLEENAVELEPPEGEALTNVE